MGFWRVRIQQDDDFEQAETFEIVLNNPVMGALEFPDRAMVQILDFEDGEEKDGFNFFCCFEICTGKQGTV